MWFDQSSVNNPPSPFSPLPPPKKKKWFFFPIQAKGSKLKWLIFEQILSFGEGWSGLAGEVMANWPVCLEEKIIAVWMGMESRTLYRSQVVNRAVIVLLFLNDEFITTSRRLEIPLPLSRLLHHLQYFVVLYFLAAIVYDVMEVVQKIFFSEQNGEMSILLANATSTRYMNSTAVNGSEFHSRRWRIEGPLHVGNDSSN